ncbi:Conserved dehydratase [Rhodococcus sp. AW25M09]|nr:Conserved dehydratase [Rhodococcus sp. AW25M09]
MIERTELDPSYHPLHQETRRGQMRRLHGQSPDATQIEDGYGFVNEYVAARHYPDDDTQALHLDTLYADTVISDKSESRSRPGEGTVTFTHTGRNQHGDVVAVASWWAVSQRNASCPRVEHRRSEIERPARSDRVRTLDASIEPCVQYRRQMSNTSAR